jgi:hypothetical protein
MRTRRCCCCCCSSWAVGENTNRTSRELVSARRDTQNEAMQQTATGGETTRTTHLPKPLPLPLPLPSSAFQIFHVRSYPDDAIDEESVMSREQTDSGWGQDVSDAGNAAMAAAS